MNSQVFHSVSVCASSTLSLCVWVCVYVCLSVCLPVCVYLSITLPLPPLIEIESLRAKRGVLRLVRDPEIPIQHEGMKIAVVLFMKHCVRLRLEKSTVVSQE